MKNTFLPQICSEQDIVDLVNELGFLPFFENDIDGFSIEDCCPRELWFSHIQDGPWEWKGPVIRDSGCAYGKFYRKKAMFISREWFPDFANYRRDGYDYDSRMDQGIARHKDNGIMLALAEQETDILSKKLKKLTCFDEDSRKTFDASLTYLQMQCYITTSDFEYMLDKNGNVYGWGVARYATPELQFGSFFTDRVYANEPAESKKKLIEYLKKLLPQATEKQILGIVG